ncbi:hypothetical protein [Nitrosomonas ureae]|uniref:Uncharacterized protein n=1 Tax=Nitrosomonas ureae TaxID=44577 RepID=A0A286A365_9PROT|nr:hypothetical protein [Nitrosomonas ureae]PTQ86578.1 hypothetical protein C8R28_10097 [Nitrosomonas ureae]SDT84535.1 hypothetical protein SAMN05216406_1026 [Nitrosomonas ureae]SOD16348.1 hypothetical protein SAMN06297164_0416 [Nitrosomonas ureae]
MAISSGTDDRDHTMEKQCDKLPQAIIALTQESSQTHTNHY